MVRNNKNIAFIVNNAPCHTQDNKFFNIGRIFISKNTTTLIQTIYRGIIKDLYWGHLAKTF